MTAREGVQSLERGLEVLRLVAEAGSNGLRLTDISELADLHKASAARLLATLSNNQALQRGPDRRYRVHDSFRSLLGMPLSTTKLRDAIRPGMSLLVDQLGDVAFISVRSGFESLCVERHVGRHPIQALSLNVGSRRPLGVGAGAMALIAHLDEGERETILAQLPSLLGHYPQISIGAIRQGINETRKNGFSDLPNFVISGMTGMGIAIRDADRNIIGALSIAAVGDRLTGARRTTAIRLLIEARDGAEKTLSARSDRPVAPARELAF